MAGNTHVWPSHSLLSPCNVTKLLQLQLHSFSCLPHKLPHKMWDWKGSGDGIQPVSSAPQLSFRFPLKQCFSECRDTQALEEA